MSKKLGRILESRLEDERETVEALKVLSELLPANTLHARRNLRSDLERRGLLLSKEFRDQLGLLVNQVQDIQVCIDCVSLEYLYLYYCDLFQSEVRSMRETCEEMQGKLANTKAKTADLLNETADLKSRGRTLEMRGTIVDSFLKRFQLSKEEVGVLLGGAVGEELFVVLQRVKRIHEDCKLLLRSSQQRVGMEIMEEMAMHLEEGYEKLYHWTQSSCRSITGDLPPSSPLLRRCLQQLKDRPILYKYCVDEYVLARRSALVQGFLNALTRGSGGGRPIELISHDPVRYVGDMMGWLHQSIATEKDQIHGLFVDNEGEWSSTLLSSVTEGAGRPLRMRVEQVLVATRNPIVAYQMVNMVRYYMSVFQGLLGSAAPLMNILNDLAELQTKMFFSTLTVHASRLMEGVELPDSDLTPPTKLVETLGILQKVLSCRDVSVSALDDRHDDLKQILNTMIDPMIQYCNESASTLSSINMAVYIINCLYLVHSTISLYEYTEIALEKLDGQIQAHVGTLVDHQAGYTLNVTGLAEVYTCCKNTGDIDDGLIDGLKVNAGSKLAQYLSAPDSAMLPQFSMITSGRCRDDLRMKASELFLAAYEQVFNTLVSKVGTDRTLLILPHPPQQARNLIT